MEHNLYDHFQKCILACLLQGIIPYIEIEKTYVSLILYLIALPAPGYIVTLFYKIYVFLRRVPWSWHFLESKGSYCYDTETSWTVSVGIFRPKMKFYTFKKHYLMTAIHMQSILSLNRRPFMLLTKEKRLCCAGIKPVCSIVHRVWPRQTYWLCFVQKINRIGNIKDKHPLKCQTGFIKSFRSKRCLLL